MGDKDIMQVGYRIRELRKEVGMSISKLAALVGISQPYLSQIERDEKQCPIDVLQKICSVLGITMAEFFAFSSKPVPIPPHLRPLLDEARALTPEQAELLARFLATLRDKSKQ